MKPIEFKRFIMRTTGEYYSTHNFNTSVLVDGDKALVTAFDTSREARAFVIFILGALLKEFGPNTVEIQVVKNIVLIVLEEDDD